MKRDRIDFLPLFYVCDTSVTANFCIYGDFSWNAGKFLSGSRKAPHRENSSDTAMHPALL